MRFHRQIVVFLFFLAASVSLLAVADETEKPPSFAEVNAEWKSLDKQLTDLASEYRKSSDDEKRREILTKYKELVNQSNELLPKLRDAAIADYKAAPNENEDVTKTLIGILADQVRRDDYEAAKELSQLLIDKNCEEAVVFELAGQIAYSLDDFAAAEASLNKAKEANALSSDGNRLLAEIDKAKVAWTAEQKIREAEAEADDLPRVKLQTNKGDVVIELYENEAPQAVANFISLVESEFYNGLIFHRVLGNFMAQAGCPRGDGTGDPGYSIYCECGKEDHRKHFRGSLSMAHAGKDSGGSQFFLTFRRTPHLDGRHTVFGRVVEGIDVLTKLQRRDPSLRRGLPDPDSIVKAEVVRKREHEYVPTKVEE